MSWRVWETLRTLLLNSINTSSGTLSISATSLAECSGGIVGAFLAEVRGGSSDDADGVVGERKKDVHKSNIWLTGQFASDTPVLTCATLDPAATHLRICCARRTDEIKIQVCRIRFRCVAADSDVSNISVPCPTHHVYTRLHLGCITLFLFGMLSPAASRQHSRMRKRE